MNIYLLDERLKKIHKFIIPAFALLFLKLLYLAFLYPCPWSVQGASFSHTEINTIWPVRAKILDRDGRILAASVKLPSLAMDPYQARYFYFGKKKKNIKEKELHEKEKARRKKRLENKKKKLQGHFSLLSERFRQELSFYENSTKSRLGHIWIERFLHFQDAEFLMKEIRKKRWMGFYILEERLRLKPYHPIGTSIIGYVQEEKEGRQKKSHIYKKFKKTFKGTLGPFKGTKGVERLFNKELSGTEGEVAFMRDGLGYPVPGTRRVLSPCIHGEDIRLSLDIGLQNYVESILKEEVENKRARTGIAVVMDADSGEILAAASKDPSTVPYNFRMFFDCYEIGSVSKPIFLGLALLHDVISPDTRIDCPKTYPLEGKEDPYVDTHFLGNETPLTEMIAYSSNTGMVQIAVKTLEKLGPNIIYNYFKSFGFGEYDGVGKMVGISRSGIFRPPDKWDPIYHAQFAIGFCYSMNIFQLSAAYATIANGGFKVTPQILRIEEPKKERTRILDEKVCTVLNECMTAVVHHGTGTKASDKDTPGRIDGYVIMGKSGTANLYNVDDLYNAIFVGILPMEDKTYIISVIFSEVTQGGGTVCAPIFRKIAKHIIAHKRGPKSP